MIVKSRILFLTFALISLLALSGQVSNVAADYLMVPMDLSQNDHLKSYGIVFWALSQKMKVEWLLNYRAGSFLIPDSRLLALQCRLEGVSYESLSSSQREEVFSEMEGKNTEVVLLEKEPKIAVYSPPGKDPWDDAVTLVLTYAKIPHKIIWDDDIQRGKLVEYDWLHLHHEDFTGQYGKFYASFHNAKWYRDKENRFKREARKAGYKTVKNHKASTARLVRDFVVSGGFLFAMCSACDSIDIALAADGVDIIAPQIDKTPLDKDYAKKLDFTRTFAFQNFELLTSPYVYEYSNIDVSDYRNTNHPEKEMFTLFEYSARFDPVEAMLTQCHYDEITGFFGQTTSFKKQLIKPGIRILGEMTGQGRAKYIHGSVGRGTFTFLAGHDPEDFSHKVGDPPTNLSLHKNSPGYRLILNNILFPAAKKKHQKT